VAVIVKVASHSGMARPAIMNSVASAAAEAPPGMRRLRREPASQPIAMNDA
jgi:hypothetical protein